MSIFVFGPVIRAPSSPRGKLAKQSLALSGIALHWKNRTNYIKEQFSEEPSGANTQSRELWELNRLELSSSDHCLMPSWLKDGYKDSRSIVNVFKEDDSSLNWQRMYMSTNGCHKTYVILFPYINHFLTIRRLHWGRLSKVYSDNPI